MIVDASPRVLLISQWPKIKNAEYELIEKIRQTGFKITVVDYLGFDVATGECINNAFLPEQYDFAISFHYDTPKFLNLHTFLWVANPLEFMHFQSNYRTALIHHLRAYDEYLYNGSEVLKGHIKRVLGSEWQDRGLSFIGSCSSNAMLEPHAADGTKANADKIFYCGVNWERGSGKSGRAQGLLDVLQQRELADFYGPRKLLDHNPWEGFTSYRGEIPFDGSTMFRTMQDYGAVLAVSSPAHMKSKTASGRVFEGIAAGVPVISDENPHIRHQFGDLVYYFDGRTEQDRADSIQMALQQIRSNPAEADRRVREAQALISREYSFEVCLQRALEAVRNPPAPVSTRTGNGSSDSAKIVDLYLFHHDPYGAGEAEADVFPNVPNILTAISSLPADGRFRVRIHYCCPGEPFSPPATAGLPNVSWVAVDFTQYDRAAWRKMRLGQKVSLLAGGSTGDFALFLSQFDFPQYDFLAKSLAWFGAHCPEDEPAIHMAGFFVNDFSAPAPPSPASILRNNSSVGLYRWSQDSIAEHQLGQFCFNRKALQVLDLERLSDFDVVLPVAILLEAMATGATVYRSRHLLLRVPYGYFHRYHNAHSDAEAKGFWALQYDLMSNYTHEINALYDVFHEHPPAVAIADRISGHDLSRQAPSTAIDPAVHTVNHFIGQLRPIYRALRRLWRGVTFFHFRRAAKV